MCGCHFFRGNRKRFVVGANTNNQITNLFDQPRITGLKGADSPFVIIWDQDVVGAILQGIFKGGSGTYNLAGDGVLTLSVSFGPVVFAMTFDELTVGDITLDGAVSMTFGGVCRDDDPECTPCADDDPECATPFE